MQAQKKISNDESYSSVDPQEVEQFARIAEEWWDEKGPFRPLHQMNPLRIRFIRDHVCEQFTRNADVPDALGGLRLLDIGCGGGLICEPMARMGANVTGIDASEKNIKTAMVHANKSGLAIDYRATTAEEEAVCGAQYDIVLALEIIEHVTDPQAFIASCAVLVKPGGLLIMTTINRTAKAFALAIVGAEYILRLLPRGTHQWRKFVTPGEMMNGFTTHGIDVIDSQGMVLHPLAREWRLSNNDLDVNYLMAGRKR